MAKNDNLTDFVTDIAETLRKALKQDPTHNINPQDFSGIITEIANGTNIETEDITITPSETMQEVSRTEGKYINKVTVNPIQTESLDVVPTQSSQSIKSPEGKYYKEVNVGAVTSAIDENITPINIRAGVTILGVEGNVAPDKPDQEKTIYPSEEEQTIIADSGHELAKVVVKAVEVESYEVMPSTSEQVVRASDGKWIKEITVKPIQTETLSVTPTQSEQTIEAPQDKYYKKVNVGAVTSAIDSNIIPTNIRSGVSILGVQGNLEPDKPNQTKTVDSSTETQVVTADPGHELESVTVNAVTSSIDSNITPENIKKDVTILGVTGTLEGGVEDTQNLIDLIEGDITILNIPNTTSKIRNYAFYYCRKLTSITIPDSVTSIGERAFYSCSKLTNVTIGSGVTSIGSYAFSNCSNLTSITIPEGVTSIGGSAFYYCDKLTSITIPDSVTSIGNNAFSQCTSLISIIIGDGVTRIGNYSFQNCSSLTSITIPNSVTSIGVDAFNGCISLNEMTILATTPPTLSSTSAIPSATKKIYIPAGTLSAYQTATNWSSFASKFVELNEDGSKPE